MIKVGSDFSGVGAFDQALRRLKIDYKTVFACDMDKYARQTYIHNYGEPHYYPENVYDREIPKESLDIYMTSPPCQSFSLAGKRKGEDSVNGVLFYNSHEFIQGNKPRYFIFENVKGLLSDAKGRTFQIWLDMLGGKSVNGNPVIFPREDATPYHIYHQVLNAKNYGVPQNRERVFIIGIRDDSDNNFHFPKEQYLTKRLKDVLEDNVDEKYYLSDNTINVLLDHQKFNKFNPIEDYNTHSSCITSHCGKFGNANNYIKVKSATKKGYEIATENDSINFSVPNSETRRGRVGKGVAQTLDTACNQGVIEPKIIGYTRDSKGKVIKRSLRDNSNTIHSSTGSGGNTDQFVLEGKPELMLKGNLSGGKWDKINESCRRYYDENGIAPTIHTCQGGNTEPKVETNYKIRRLSVRECFRLMDFPDSFMDKLFIKKTLYFQFVYSKFGKNKKETICNAKLKIVPENQIQENLETSVLCTTKECQKLEQLKTNFTKIKSKGNLLNVNFVIEKLGELEQKECVINITKWTDYTETLYMLIKEGKNQVVVDISGIEKEIKSTDKLWRITWKENLSKEKLCITLILLRQIMELKIFTYAKTPQNTLRYISSTIDLEKGLENLHLLYLKMDYTKQLISDSMLYKQAGNSIVVNVLAEIIKKLKL